MRSAVMTIWRTGHGARTNVLPSSTSVHAVLTGSNVPEMNLTFSRHPIFPNTYHKPDSHSTSVYVYIMDFPTDMISDAKKMFP